MSTLSVQPQLARLANAVLHAETDASLETTSARKMGPHREAITEPIDRNEVILQHLHLVKAIAARVHDNLPVHIEQEDLVHAGIIGLIDAASKFDPSKQVSFSSYAKHRIKGSILDSLRQLDWASRDMRRRFKRIEAVVRELTSELHRDPTEMEIAARLGITVEEWREMTVELQQIELISADTRVHDYDEVPQLEFASDSAELPDQLCAKGEMTDALKEALKTLPERYRQVVMLYYSDELTMKEIGGMMGINESRVSQIHKSALEKLQAALLEVGITRHHALAG